MKLRSVLIAVTLLLVSVIVCGCGTAGKAENENLVMDGYIDLEEFGGYASDNKDDTEAFKKALATGRNIYLRKGEYTVSDTICVQDQNIIGADETTITATKLDVNAPIIKIGGLCRIENFSIKYDTALLTYKEKEGERVGIQLGNKTSVSPGTVLREIQISDTGTGLYSPDGENMGACGMRVDTCNISRYSYRGVSFLKKGQYGNHFFNFYICNLHSKERFEGDEPLYANAAFAVEGEEYNLQADQLNIEGMQVENDLLLRNCHNAQIGSLHIEAVAVKNAYNGFVKVENSSVKIETVCCYYLKMHQPNQSVFELGNADSPNKNGNYLHVGTLHFKGLGSDTVGFKSTNGKSFKMVQRTKDAKGTFNFELDKYVWYTWLGEADVYKSFPTENNPSINYISKGF